MAYLLDTDIVIDHLGDDPATVALLFHLTTSGLSISLVTYMETYQGVLQDTDPIAAVSAFDEFLDGVLVLPFSLPVARRCAELRKDLRQSGRRIRPRALDLITAATVLHFNLTLVTRNTADYSDIPGLSLY